MVIYKNVFPFCLKTYRNFIKEGGVCTQLTVYLRASTVCMDELYRCKSALKKKQTENKKQMNGSLTSLTSHRKNFEYSKAPPLLVIRFGFQHAAETAGAVGGAGVAKAVGAAETPGVAGAAETPGVAGAAETPGVAGAAETPGAAKAVGAAETPGAAKAVGAAETPGTAKAVGAAETPGAAGASRVDEAAETARVAEAVSSSEGQALTRMSHRR